MFLAGNSVASTLHGLLPHVFGRVWAASAVSHSVMLGASLLLIRFASGGRLSSFGFRRPRGPWGVHVVSIALVISIGIWAVGRLLPGHGLVFIEEYSLIGELLLIWVYASVAEETLTRGLVQGILSPLRGRGVNLFGVWFGLPTVVAATFFALMHLVLVSAGVDGWTVARVLVFAFAIGLLAGTYREKTGSLIPAIAAHSTANVVGTLLGRLG